MLVGQKIQTETFLSATHGGRLHHAWLLIGPQGLGKAGFAQQAALRLLSEASSTPVEAKGLDVEGSHPTIKLAAAGSHPDLIVLKRLEKEKSGETARNVTIEQVRHLLGQFNLAPSQGNRRVVIIDSIDDLERGAANALLKALEEPPASTIFLLVSHASDRLLPTIRSRCRTLRFPRLSDDDLRGVLKTECPELSDRELDALVSVGEGVPGRALRFSGLDISGLDAALSTFSIDGDRDSSGRHALAVQLSAKAATPRYAAFLDRVPAFLATLARQKNGEALATALRQWEAARSLADSAVHNSLDPYMVTFALGSLVTALAPTL
jgi:DNA polymerase-3 subunit delta'